jgi:hypothetical protein
MIFYKKYLSDLWFRNGDVLTLFLLVSVHPPRQKTLFQNIFQYLLSTLFNANSTLNYVGSFNVSVWPVYLVLEKKSIVAKLRWINIDFHIFKASFFVILTLI